MDSLAEYSPVLTLVFTAWLWYSPGLIQSGLFWIFYFYTFGSSTDLVLLLSISWWKGWIQLNSSALWPLLAKAIVGVVTSIVVLRVAAARPKRPSVQGQLKGEVLPSKAHLIPCRTTHTRLFPKKHSFSYSYLTAGIPVGFRGAAGNLLTIDSELDSPSWLEWIQSPGGWFNVSSTDYLQRGTCRGGLRGKLDNYLVSQDEDPSQYPHAYLVTAARFLGYHFNPVSFWYLYSSDKILTAIVLEVNNTFGERRPYFVSRDFESEKELPASTETTEMRARVRSSWNKDFHVSPFNSRKGTYSLLASDPLGANMDGFRGIDVTINLSSSKGHPKMVARLFSEGDAVDPTSMHSFRWVAFLFTWFWVGFVTFPRIVKEAATLFFKRSLHVWYRPEPLKDSLGRLADDTEQVLENVFRLYLRQLVKSSSERLIVKYVPSGIATRDEEAMVSNASGSSEDAESVEFRVLTPAFYSRFVHYAHDFEGIFSEMAESSTIWIDKPQLLPKIFLKRPSRPLRSSAIMDYVPFRVIQGLRHRPEPIVRPLTSAAEVPPSTTTATDVRGFRISAMDAFVLGQTDSSLRKTYKWTLVWMFVTERMLGDYAALLPMLSLAARIAILWAAVTASGLYVAAAR